MSEIPILKLEVTDLNPPLGAKAQRCSLRCENRAAYRITAGMPDPQTGQPVDVERLACVEHLNRACNTLLLDDLGALVTVEFFARSSTGAAPDSAPSPTVGGVAGGE